MIAWTSGQWLVLTVACLVLAGAAVSRQRLGSRRMLTYGLIWLAIFLVVTMVFWLVR